MPSSTETGGCGRTASCFYFLEESVEREYLVVTVPQHMEVRIVRSMFSHEVVISGVPDDIAVRIMRKEEDDD